MLEETNNLQGGILGTGKSFIRKDIIGRKEAYLIGRRNFEFDNFLQGKYCTVYKELLFGGKTLQGKEGTSTGDNTYSDWEIP